MTTNVRVMNKKRINLADSSFRLLMLLPAFILLGVFMFYPIFETFRISLTRSSALAMGVYVGLQNYIKLFADTDFQQGLLHVFQWAFWSIIIQIPLSFFIAYSCANIKTKVTKSLKSIYYLGNVIPVTIIALLSNFILMPSSGAIITFSQLMGWKNLAGIDFIGNSNIAFWTVFVVATWAYIGFGIVYLMANIEQIPSELIEAAMIDGANRWQIVRFVVIPQISYSVRILALLSAVGSIKLFDLPWLMETGGPGNATTTLAIELYKQGFINLQYGKGAAIGVVIFIISLIFTIVQFSIQRKNQD